MSRAAKSTLFATVTLCAATVVGVHYLQRSERAAMHQGVINDEARQRVKRERQEDFEMQRALEEEYRKGQTVSEVRDVTPGGGVGR